MDEQEKLLQYAFKIIQADRNDLMIRHPFMARALYELKAVPISGLFAQTGKLNAADGVSYYFDPSRLLAVYAEQNASTEHAYLHSVLHCLYLHPFFASMRRERNLWDLACDICIWDILCSLEPEALTDPIRAIQNSPTQMSAPSVPWNFQQQKTAVTAQLKSVMKTLTAQNVYRYLTKGGQCQNICGLSLEDLSTLFSVDDHSFWYKNDHAKHQQNRRENSDSQNNNFGDSDSEKNSSESDGSDSSNPENRGSDSSNPENRGSDSADSDDCGSGSNNSGDAGLNECASQGVSQDPLSAWAEIATQVEVELTIDSQKRNKNRGDQGGQILQSLQGIEREHLDYTAFLRKFATLEEKMEVDPDSFDYNYYTYGLSLFGDMPLIEPLEYKETHAIRDFVVAIDTSGSCDLGLIRKFLTKTYDILSEKHIFQEIVNIHIMQCDAVLQENVCLHNQEELENYIKNFTVKGQGGTDFRPVFTAVEELRSRGELSHIRGLLYFTDGYGVFPSRPTDYKTAFVFVQSESPVRVPPWAMKIMMEEEDL